MTNVEQRLRETFRNKVAGTAPSPVTAPRGLRARVRRRQARNASIALLLAAAITVGAAVGARTLRTSSDGRPATGPTVIPPADDREAVLASGTFRERHWALLVRHGPEGWCIEVREPRGQGGGCGFGVPPRDVGYSSSSGRGLPTFVDGPISDRVASVRLRLTDGRTLDAQILESPARIGAPFDVYLLVVTRSVSVRQVVALDAEGRIIDRITVPEAPDPDDTRGGLSRDHLGAIVDIHENVWAHLHPSEFDSDPAASPGATRVPVETIRFTAGLRLDDVWSPVREWWARRPPPEASDRAFYGWWSTYPFAETEGQ